MSRREKKPTHQPKQYELKTGVFVGNPQVQITITSPGNHLRLDAVGLINC